MARIVVLDAGPLGLVSNPSSTPAALRARAWIEGLAAADHRIVVPEIADYEVRRELLRAGRRTGLERLDLLLGLLEFLPLTTPAMRLAARLWADARRAGQPTATDAALDGDVILAAQARLLGDASIVATTNPAHLVRYTAAQVWHEIA